MGFTLGEGNRARTFDNRVKALQYIAATVSHAGWKRPVTDQYMPTDGNGRGYGSWLHKYQWHMTFEQYQQLAPVAQRLRHLHHFLTEVDAKWRDVPGTRVYWADNSVEVTQRDRHGNTRVKMLAAPSGDACF